MDVAKPLIRRDQPSRSDLLKDGAVKQYKSWRVARLKKMRRRRRKSKSRAQVKPKT